MTVIAFGAGRVLSRLALAGYILFFLFCLLAALAGFGHATGAAGLDPLPEMWLTGFGSLIAAGFAAHGIRRKFRSIGRIEVDQAGGWQLFSPTGKMLTLIEARIKRSLVLWVRAGPLEGAPQADTLHGRLLLPETGRTFVLAGSQVFDLFFRLGYGPWWLDHPNRTAAEENTETAAAGRHVFIGEGRKKGLVLPEHGVDPAGLAMVKAFLENPRRVQA